MPAVDRFRVLGDRVGRTEADAREALGRIGISELPTYLTAYTRPGNAQDMKRDEDALAASRQLLVVFVPTPPR